MTRPAGRISGIDEVFRALRTCDSDPPTAFAGVGGATRSRNKFGDRKHGCRIVEFSRLQAV
jgi:hypothetical protein